MSDSIRAAVIGASGMGKHHAKWLNALDCEVVAFAGSSEESVAATSETLADLFGFTGRGYVGAEAMLDRAKPDVVAICSPAHLHHEHFLLAVERGCHIMCEKPLVWDADKPLPRLLDEAAEMVEAAKTAGVVGAVNTQYAAAVEPYPALCREADAGVSVDAFSEFSMRMDSRGGKQGATGEKIWIDLASHPLSVLMAFAGPGGMAPGSEACTITEKGTAATFAYTRAGGSQVQATIEVCNVPEGDLARRFGIDNVLVDYEGRNDDEGVYAAYLSLGEVEQRATDFVQTSISRFADAVRGRGEPLASLDDGLTNLKMQLRLLQIGRGEGAMK